MLKIEQFDFAQEIYSTTDPLKKDELLVQIDEIVYMLFGLTEEERACIKRTMDKEN